MSRQTLTMLAAFLLVFGSGLAVGLYFGSGDGPTSGSLTKTTTSFLFGNATTDDARNDLHENKVLSSRILELEKQLAALRDKDSAATLDRVAFFKKFGKAINIQPFDQSIKMTPEMAGLLGLSAAERGKVEQDLAGAKSDLDKLEQADTKITKQTDQSVSYDIAADKEGAAVKQNLHDQLAQDIGDDRADVFMGDGQNWSFQTVFSGFLDSKRQIQISWKTDNGNVTYSTSVQSGTGSYSTSGSTVQPEYQKYLPDGAPGAAR